VANSELFKGFLLSAQLESSKESSTPVTLDVYLMNGQKISLEVITSDPSDEVLEVCFLFQSAMYENKIVSLCL